MKRPACVTLLIAVATLACNADDARLTALNERFIAHARQLGSEYAIAAQLIADSAAAYKDTPQSFVPDALAILYPAYRQGLEAFDGGDYAVAAQRFAGALTAEDPYLAANAAYFHARAQVERGLLEEAEHAAAQFLEQHDDLAQFTPYAAHLRFVLAYCQASNLRIDAAIATLRRIEGDFADAPEPVRIGVRQLLLELERRQTGTLDEVATLMSYSASRLHAADATQRVRQRQQEILNLLDQLIQNAEQQEEQQKSQSKSGSRGQQQPQQPRQAAQESELPPSAAGDMGQQHAAPTADPGEMWGRLPPAQRDQILESLRDRFPSRYRALVEQYYRSLAEEK